MDTITFAELGLSAKVLEAITSAGYTIPTPIQAQAIPIALTGRDVLGIAQTGTGKTASFTLPMISRLETGRARARMPRSLILAPTRELAAQVAQSFEKYGVNHKLDVALLIGGVSMDEQTRKLERGVDVLIATPGRLLDHFQRGRILLMGVEILVIDEADRMLDMGFIPDIEKICKLLPPQRQTLFFSATMPPEITRLVHTFMRDPERIEAAPPATTAKTIIQRFIYAPTGEDWDKREMLRGLLREDGVRNAIIFCNRKVDVAIVHKSLVKHGFNAGALHGDMEQRDRTMTLDKFRNGDVKFLVASDVAARGLDIPDVSHVFNFDLPRDKDDYVHRIGRTGRAGKEGNATSIVAPIDLKQFLEIQKMTKVEATWLGIAPTEEDYADAGKRRKGKGPTSRGSAPSRSGRPERDGRSERNGRSDRSGRNRPPARPQAAIPSPVLDAPILEAPIGGNDADVRPASRGEGGPRPERGPRPDGHSRTARGDRGPRPERKPMDRESGVRDTGGRDTGGRASGGQDDRRGRPAPAADRRPRVVADNTGGVSEPQRNKPQPHSPSSAGQPRGVAPGPVRSQRPAPVADQRGNDGGGHGGSSFADNVPAFLRRPSRPAKVAGES